MKPRILEPDETLQAGDEFREFAAGEERPSPDATRGNRPEVWRQTACVGMRVRYPDFYRRPSAASGSERKGDATLAHP